MVKLLPIPSLKKVRITKTKPQQRNRPMTPRQSQSQKNLLYNQDMMLQNAHGPVPTATFAPNIPKEMIPWLCTSIAIASPLRNQAKRKRSSGKSPRRAPPRKNPRICKNCSRTLVSIGFVCYLLSCCVAFFNRECVGETRQVSRRFPPGKEA